MTTLDPAELLSLLERLQSGPLTAPQQAGLSALIGYLREGGTLVAGDLVQGDRISIGDINHSIVAIGGAQVHVERLTDADRVLLESLRDLLAGARRPWRRARYEYDVFISYAWADGKDLATRLHEDLKAAGLRVFRDEEELRSDGDRFRAQLEARLKASARVAVLISPEAATKAALPGSNIALEWATSIAECKPVIPLLLGEAALIPEDWRGLLYRDFTEASAYESMRDALIADLKAPVPPIADLHGFPSLPATYLPRKADLADIARLALAVESATVISSEQRTQVQTQKAGASVTALRGMGGVGKSVLANAFGRSAGARRAFTDGVFWVTVGRDKYPKLAEAMADISRALGGPTEFKTAADWPKLKEVLKDALALIVLDDVWDMAHAEPFLNAVEGSACRLLITTRDGELAHALGAAEHRVDILRPAEALALLAGWVGQSAEELPIEAVQVADECGYLPFALALCGAMAKDGAAWAQVLSLLQQADLAEIHRRLPNYEFPNVLRALKASIDMLRLQLMEQYDDAEKVEAFIGHYHEIGVFQADASIPEETIVRLWVSTNGISAESARLWIGRLAQKELLRTEGESPQRRISLHDLQHDYLRAALKDLPSLHAELLVMYNPESKPWYEVEDEGYLYDHLVYHLMGAGQHEAIHALFDNDRWMKVRFAQSGYTYKGFIADLMVAWEQLSYPAALRQIETGEEPSEIACCVRYALIRTSINSLAGNYVPELVTRAVEIGLPGWSVERALAIAKNVPAPEQKSRILVLLLRQGGLIAPLRNLISELVLEAIVTIEDERDRSRTLARVAPHLEGELLALGLEAALIIGNARWRAEALAALAPQFDEEQRKEMLARELEAALSAERSADHVRVLVALAPQMEVEQKRGLLARALELALAIEDEMIRANELAVLAPQLEGVQKQEGLAHGLAATLSIEHELFRAWALIALVPQLEGDLLERGLVAALNIKHEEYRAEALTALAPQLTGDLLARGLEVALDMRYEENRAKALAALASQLCGEQKQRALSQGLDAATAIWHGWPRAEALAALAPQLHGGQKQQALSQGLEAAFELEDGQYCMTALAALAPQLQGDLLHQGLDAALIINDVGICVMALAALAPQLEGEQKQQALALGLEAARDIENYEYRAEVLVALVPQLEADLLARGLDITHFIGDEGPRAQVLAALAPRLTEDLLPRGLDATLSLEDDEYRATVLAALAPRLEGNLLARGMEAALALENKEYRAKALAALAEQVQGEQKQEILARGLEAALFISDDSLRVKALATLATHLQGKQKQQVLAIGVEIALAVKHDMPRAQALATLAEQEQGGQKQEILARGLEAALSITDESSLAKALAALAPQMEGDLVERVLETILPITDEWSRAKALAALAPQLAGGLAEGMLETALAMKVEWCRVTVLKALAPQMACATNLQVLLSALSRSLNEERGAVLRLLTIEAVWQPECVSQLIVEAVAQHVEEICWEWQWQ